MLRHSVQHKVDLLRKEWNIIGNEMRDRKKANKEDPVADLLARKAANEHETAEVEKSVKTMKKELDQLVNTAGNIVHESVPVSNN